MRRPDRTDIIGLGVIAVLVAAIALGIRHDIKSSAEVSAIETVGEAVADDSNHEIKRARRATAAAVAEGKSNVQAAAGADAPLDPDLIARHAAGIVGVRDAASADRDPEGGESPLPGT